MGLSSQEGKVRLKRYLLSPFKRLECRFKGFFQTFILKTIEKQGLSGTSESVESELHAVLSMLRSNRRRVSYQSPAFNAIDVQGYLLSGHPRSSFFYHRTKDLGETPWILNGAYESDVTAWLCDKVQDDERVLVIGGRQGYHAVTIADRIGRTGRLMILSDADDDRQTIELNLRTNRLLHQVEIGELAQHGLRSPGQDLLSRITEFSPTLTLIDNPQNPEHLTCCSHLFPRIPTYSILAGQVIATADCNPDAIAQNKAA